ncbi:RND efflux system outer membrane lipoprotein [Cupriavidus basilensis OR16]|uniref:RND efflux system outer membrane lipoprotein n=1 Tax=Cupriavidus basilensis OR16 TaxID=1127483 RepID=H1S1V7_9BURK|nr:RND efflux system outer membrane lipoprotein [Cupriavidus basilensis OR16]
MKLYRCAASAVLVTLATGCSLQPVYKRPAAPVSTVFPAGEAYKAPSVGAGSTMLPAANIGWRNFLPDPRLQRLVGLALENNRDLRVAVLNVEKVQAQYRIQRAALYPQVNAGASASTKSTSTGGSAGNTNSTSNYSVGLSASWEMDFFGRLRSLSDAALEQYLASAHARQAVEILLVSQIADQYLTTLAFDEQLAVTQSTLKTAQAAYTIVKLQFDTGTASELDLRLSQTTVEQAQANYAAQIRLRAQAENALALLVGQPLPLDLPPPVRPGRPADPRRHTSRTAFGSAGTPPGHPGGRSSPAVRKCGHRRCTRGILSAHLIDRRPRHCQCHTRRLVRSRIQRMVLHTIAGHADLHRWRESGQPGCCDGAEGHRHRAIREGGPDRFPRGFRRAGSARNLRRSVGSGTALHRCPAASAGACKYGVRERDRQLSERADRADRLVQRAAGVGHDTPEPPDQSCRPVPLARRRLDPAHRRRTTAG